MSTFAVPVTLETAIALSSFDEKSLRVTSPVSRMNVLEKQLQFWVSRGEGEDGPLFLLWSSMRFRHIPWCGPSEQMASR